MKKIVVMLLVLLLLGLSGQQGCAPGMEEFRPGEEKFPGLRPTGEEAKVRGLTVEYVRDKPLLTSIPGERLPVIWADEEFYVGLKIDNYALKKIKTDVHVFSLASGVYGGRIVEGRDSLILEKADLEGDVIHPSSSNMEFGAFVYSKARVGEFLEDSLITNVDLDYDALITADLCFTRELDSLECNNHETLSENYLKGDAGTLPVSISEITKQAIVKDGTANVKLFIKFRNFGNGYIEGNRINSFSAKIGSTILKCEDVIFSGSGAETTCKGNFNIESMFVTLPARFEFNYGYEVKKSINYKVVSE